MDQPEHKTILVVDDDHAFQRVLTERLKQAEFVVQNAFDGKHGLGVALKERPDLIILDLQMPGMDGLETLRRLRATDWGKSVPVFILTTLSSTDEQRNQAVTELEPTYYIEKSTLQPDDLIMKIHERLLPEVS